MNDNQEVYLLFSDHDIVDFLFESDPPEGITLKRNEGLLIQAGADSGGVFVSVLISIPVGVTINILSHWIITQLKKSKKPETTINKTKVVFKETEVETFFKKTITRQYEEYREWSNDEE